MKNINIELNDYLNSVDMLADYFANRYFGKDNDLWWVGDDIGGVAVIADYFFNMSDIVEFIKYKYSRKQMFEYYDYKLDYQMKPNHKKDDVLICIRDYKKLK
jgi:hypothetical protein